jgi:catechol 2,3-dioxygenase-like lactoylglutathione lyase family enzyme
MNTRIAVVSLWAPDVAAAAQFYRDVLGLRTVKKRHKRAHFHLGGTYLVLLQGRPVPAEDSVPARFPLLAFAVDNLDAALERLHEHQVRLPWGIGHDAHSRWAMFHDPAGNLIELVEEERETAGGWQSAVGSGQ